MADTQLAALKPHPQNYNHHSEAQIKRLMESLERFGQPKEIVTWQGMIIAGHGLVEAARRLGLPTLRACDMTMDWSETEALAFMAADNELARLGDPDEAALAQLVAGLGDVDAQLAALAAGTEERLKELLATLKDPPEDPGPQINKAEELREKWGVETGQLWQLGEHRLICGDCTDATVVTRVMGGEKADLVVTDPPYAVDYAAKNRALQTIGRSNRLTTDIEGDTLGTEETAKAIWEPAFSNAYDASRNGAVIYCFAPQGGDQMMMMMMMMLRAKWNDRLHQLIWRKNAPTFSMGRLDYSYQHEPILYSWRGTNHGFYGDKARSIIDCDRPSASKLHPTMKPVELIEILIKNSSRSGETILEPFSGSGTTLIACERLGRRCRAVEISPANCAVAIQRWADMTGGTPELING